MVDIEEFCEIANELYDELPESIYEELNGGVIIEEEYRTDPNNIGLIVLGLYERSILGRYIRLYYGSFMSMYGSLDREELKDKLRETFHHELTHHVEFLAKERDLEIEDIKFIENYKKSKENR